MRSALLCLALLTACSSSNFEVASVSDTGADDTSATVDTATPPDDTGTMDSGTADTGSIDGGRVDAPPGTCTPLAANPTTLWVDQRSTKASIGTSECPFKTIKEATNFVAALPMASGAHTIRVAGGTATSPLVYDEPMLVLKPQTTLLGDGANRVTIIGGGTCGETTCMVVMENNTTLEGVTVNAKLGQKIPVAMGPALLTVATVRGVTITGTKDDKTPGIYVEGYGWSDIGPDTRIVDNGGWGIFMKSGGALRLNGTASAPVEVSRNLMGIQLTGGKLEINGAAIVQKNKTHGVVLTMADKTTHSIDGLTATDHVGYGVYVDGGAGLRMRNSKLVRNDIGLVFRLASGNELDLGTALQPGNNFIGGISDRNKRAGICLPSYRAGTSPARSNSWTLCPTPSSGVVIEGEKACDSVPATDAYKDVYYGVPSMTTAPPVFPFDTDGCSTK